MQEERAEEFVGIESQGASAMPMGVVSPQEADFVIGHGKESGVGDGNAVGIAREVGQDLGRAGKGSLGINDLVGLGCVGQPGGQSCRGKYFNNLHNTPMAVLADVGNGSGQLPR